MNEPKRWIEEGPPEAVERLLEAAAAEKPSEGSLRRVLAGVGAGLGATGAAATAGAVATAGTGAALATGKAVAASAWVKWVFLGVTAVGAGTVAVRQASRSTEVPRAAKTAVAAPKVAPPATAVMAPAAAPSVVEAPAVEEKPKATLVVASKPAPAPVAADAPIDAERLAEEVRAVDRARSALANGRALETLAALDEYERSGGRRFAPEVLYLRMQALLALGRKTEAQSVAERLVRGFPKSPHTARARRVLETIP